MTTESRSLVVLVVAAVLMSACASAGNAVVTPTTDAPVVTGEASADDDAGQTVGTPAEPDPPTRLGPTFSKMTEPGVGGRITSLAFDPDDPNRLLVGGDMLGIAVTDDFGQSWNETTGLASWEIGDITPVRSSDGHIWTGSLSGPQASIDGGITWELRRNGMPPLSDSNYSMPVDAVLVDPENPSVIRAFNGNQRNWPAAGVYRDGIWQGDGSVWKSTDGGATWQQLAVVAPNTNIRAATHLGGQSTLLLAATSDAGARRSLDGGITWTDASQGLPHLDTYDVWADPVDPTRAWIALGPGPLGDDGRHVPGGIWRTEDGAESWQPVNEGMTIVGNQTLGDTASFHQIVGTPDDPERLYTSNVAPGQAAVYRSDDGGDSWRIVADGATIWPNPYDGALRAFDIAVHPDDADRVAIGSDDAVLGSTDGGTNWTDLTTIEDTTAGFFAGRGYSGLVSTDIVFDPEQPGEVVLLGFDGGNFVQTIDDGLTWRRTAQTVSRWGGAIEGVYSPSDPDRLLVLLGQFSNFRGVGISDDGGATFRLLAGADVGLPEAGTVAGPNERGIAIAETGGADLVFVALGGQLLRSDDGGELWAPVPGLTDVRDVEIAASGDAVWVATSSSVLRSLDGGIGFDFVAGAPSGVTHLYASAAEPDAMYTVAFRAPNGGVQRWHGDGWESVFDDPFAHAIAIDPIDPTRLAVVTTEPAFHDVSNATGVHFSIDGGRNWSIMNDGLSMTRARTVEFDPHDPDRLIVGTTGRGFYEVSFGQATGSPR